MSRPVHYIYTISSFARHVRCVAVAGSYPLIAKYLLNMALDGFDRVSNVHTEDEHQTLSVITYMVPSWAASSGSFPGVVMTSSPVTVLPNIRLLDGSCAALNSKQRTRISNGPTEQSRRDLDVFLQSDIENDRIMSVVARGKIPSHRCRKLTIKLFAQLVSSSKTYCILSPIRVVPACIDGHGYF